MSASQKYRTPKDGVYSNLLMDGRKERENPKKCRGMHGASAIKVWHSNAIIRGTMAPIDDTSFRLFSNLFGKSENRHSHQKQTRSNSLGERSNAEPVTFLSPSGFCSLKSCIYDYGDKNADGISRKESLSLSLLWARL